MAKPKQEKKLSVEEKLRKYTNLYINDSDSDEDWSNLNDDYGFNSSIFIKYDSDNDDTILNDDDVDTNSYGISVYDSDDEKVLSLKKS